MKKKVIRIVALVVAIVAIISSIFIIRGCSAPPKYEEVEARFLELMEASKGVNKVIFGEGLPVYERVSDPQDSVTAYKTGEFYTDGDGNQKERVIYYYQTLEKEREVVAFRDSYLEKYAYVFVSDKEMTADELKLLFPAIENLTAPEGESFYSEKYRSADGKQISYLVPFVEPTYDFYYTSADPEEYDYVRDDSKYRTIDDIKAYAETVYSRSYMLSLYGSLFDGVASGDTVLRARYVEYIESSGSRLALLNSYEPLYSEERQYDFSTAKIEKWGSSAKRVRISVESYLPSAPDKRVEVEIGLVLQDGEWYLDSPTF